MSVDCGRKMEYLEGTHRVQYRENMQEGPLHWEISAVSGNHSEPYKITFDVT